MSSNHRRHRLHLQHDAGDDDGDGRHYVSLVESDDTMNNNDDHHATTIPAASSSPSSSIKSTNRSTNTTTTSSSSSSMSNPRYVVVAAAAANDRHHHDDNDRDDHNDHDALMILSSSSDAAINSTSIISVIIDHHHQPKNEMRKKKKKKNRINSSSDDDDDDDDIVDTDTAGVGDDSSVATSSSTSTSTASTSSNLSPSSTLYLCCFFLLIGWVLNNIGWIYVSMRFGSVYAYYMDVSTSIIFLVLQSPVVVYRFWVTKSITTEMRNEVKGKTYMMLGFIDAIYNLLTTLSSPHTSSQVQNLIFQLPIPLAMLGTKLLWPKTTSFKTGQYLGAGVILGGAAWAIVPEMIQQRESENGGNGSGQQDNPPSALIVYIIGTIFFSINTVYKESIFRSAPTIDFWYFSFLENIWSLVFTFVLIPLLWIPGVGYDTYNTTWVHFSGGFRCMFEGASEMDQSASCENGFLICVVWIVSNIFVNILGLMVMKYGNSILYNIINSIQLPITNMCFASTFIMTAALVTPFSNTIVCTTDIYEHRNIRTHIRMVCVCVCSFASFVCFDNITHIFSHTDVISYFHSFFLSSPIHPSISSSPPPSLSLSLMSSSS